MLRIFSLQNHTETPCKYIFAILNKINVTSLYCIIDNELSKNWLSLRELLRTERYDMYVITVY